MSVNLDVENATREIPGVGRLDFEQTEKSRAYWFLPEGGQRRTRLPSVTTVIRDSWPKPQLLEWYAREPNASTILANAAVRGKVVHKFVETYLTTGELLDVGDFPPDFAGFLRGAARFLFEYDPQPEAVERLVVHPDHRYAGRLDLIARLADAPDLRTLVDFKSNPKGAVYAEAHVQGQAYKSADHRCGGEPIDRVLIVGLDENGNVNPVASDQDAALRMWQSVLAFYGEMKRYEKALA